MVLKKHNVLMLKQKQQESEMLNYQNQDKDPKQKEVL